MPKIIKQSVTFKVPPHEIYELLMDSKKHSSFTGDSADVSRKVGGTFTAYGDYIQGENLELVPDAKIVQSWRASDWPREHFSKVSFVLKKHNGGTLLAFTQTDVPDSQYQSIKQGWLDYYWKPMKATLEK